MSWEEIEEWRIIDAIDPIGYPRLEMIAGMLANAVHAANANKNGIKSLTDYIMFDETKKPKLEMSSHDELVEQGKAWVRAVGGVIK